MIRKLLLPALAATLLAGCMSSGYDYRGGRGDYYYGEPSTEYRYEGYGYGGYGSIGYGYPGGWNGSIGYGYPYGFSRFSRYGYGYPYGFYNGWYGYPYAPYHHHHHNPRPPNPTSPPPGDVGPGAPWRDPDEIGRRRHRDPEPAPRGVSSLPPRPQTEQPRAPIRRSEMIRERRQELRDRGERSEQTP